MNVLVLNRELAMPDLEKAITDLIMGINDLKEGSKQESNIGTYLVNGKTVVVKVSLEEAKLRLIKKEED
jgi:hypothetical protein